MRRSVNGLWLRDSRITGLIISLINHIVPTYVYSWRFGQKHARFNSTYLQQLAEIPYVCILWKDRLYDNTLTI